MVNVQIKPQFKIVLLSPEIPGNTGSIGRTCVALGIELIIIGQCGFDLSEKAVRRAGLDYWKHVWLSEYQHWDEFIQARKVDEKDLFFFEQYPEKSIFDATFTPHCYLIFGGETKGTPIDLEKKYSSQFYHLPQYSEVIRSLNLSNAVTAAAYIAHGKILSKL